MSTGFILSREEIAAWTRARTKKGQIEVLRRARVRFIIAADGWPSVARSQLEPQPGEHAVADTAEPDWSAIR